MVTVLSVFQSTDCAEMDRKLLVGTSIRHESLSLNGFALGKLWQRARTSLGRKLMTYFRWSSPWVLGPIKPLLRMASSIPADLTIVHNEAPFWVGSHLVKNDRLVAADFEDWYSEDLFPSARRTRPLKLIRQLEHQILHEAVYCTTTSHSLAEALANSYEAPKPTVIPNCFPLQPQPSTRPQRIPELVWFSQTIGPGRGLEEFISNWSRLPPACGRLTLIGSLNPEYGCVLHELMPEIARDRLEFRPSIPADELPGALACFDVGLALEHQTPANKNLTISNKIFQYLNAGLAIIATPTKGQNEVMTQAPNAGLLVNIHSSECTSVLGNFLSNPEQLADAQAASRRAAETYYSWEKHSQVLLDLVGQALRPTN